METTAPETRTAGSLRAWVQALRPRQWLKNLPVLAALFFSRQLRVPHAAGAAFAAVGVFCLLASATYLANDVADRERDRLHPTKKSRPIAAGLVPPGRAVALAVLLAAAGLAGAFFINVPTGIVGASYLALQALYTLKLKQVALLDIGCIAGGFVLRVVAGAEAVKVPISHWLYLCTLLLALFLALGKRRHELVLLDEDAASHRGALAQYSVELVDQMMSAITACLILAYALYTVSPETIAKFGTDRLKFTVPVVLYGVFRYLFLIHKRGAGGAPEKVLTSDRPMLATIVVYTVMVAVILYR